MTADRARGDERLPPTGSVKVVGPRKAARLVERVAEDAENPAVSTERPLPAPSGREHDLVPGPVRMGDRIHDAGAERLILGSVKVVGPRKAARLVERVAEDAENPAVSTERLLIALDVDGTVLEHVLDPARPLPAPSGREHDLVPGPVRMGDRIHDSSSASRRMPRTRPFRRSGCSSPSTSTGRCCSRMEHTAYSGASSSTCWIPRVPSQLRPVASMTSCPALR
jgi:hypothetical protein